MKKQIYRLKDAFDNEDIQFFEDRPHVLEVINSDSLYSYILTIIEKTNNIEFFKYIIENQNHIPVSFDDNRFIKTSIIKNKFEFVKYLINHKDFIFDDHYISAFNTSCALNQLKTIKYIVDNKKINISNTDSLFVALKRNNIEIFDYLLKNTNINPTLNNHLLLFDICRSEKMNFLNSLINHKLYLFLKYYFNDICLYKLKKQDLYLFYMLYDITSLQKDINEYFRKHYSSKYDIFKKNIISNKMQSF